MGVTDLFGVGPVIARRLEAAGLGTVAAIAAATIDELMRVPGVGPNTAERMHDEVREMVGDASPTDEIEKARTAKVAKYVKRLRGSIPDLAKSRKDAKRLKQSTKLMAGWVDDLGRRSVRKRFVAEVTRISDEAKKRTDSKKDAEALRQHASRIKDAVRKAS